MVGHVAKMEEGENRNTHKRFDGRSKGKRLLTSPVRKLEDNSKIYLEETVWETVRCVKLAEVWVSGSLLTTQS